MDPFRDIEGIRREGVDREKEIADSFRDAVPNMADGLITPRARRPLRDRMRLRNLLPDSLDAYARLFHPLQGGRGLIRWRDIVGEATYPSLRVAQLKTALREASSKSGQSITKAEPLVGMLDIKSAGHLADTIGKIPPLNEDAQFLFWAGMGGLGFERDAVYSGRVENVTRFLVEEMKSQFRSPSVWWGTSRLWVVATHTDSTSTYIGGPRDLIRALLRDRSLDIFPADLSDEVDDVTARQ